MNVCVCLSSKIVRECRKTEKNNTTKNYLSILIGNERYIFECKLNIIECHNE